MIYVHKPNSKKYIEIEREAFRRGATKFGLSTKGDYKYYVVHGGRTIHFGYRHMSDYSWHNDLERRNRYRARHGKIKTKSGELAYLDKNRASYWSWHLLW